MLRVRFRMILPVLLPGALACAGTDGGATGGAGLDGPDRALALARQPMYEVGGADADGWAAFGNIADVGFDAEGNLYVLDSQATQVHVIGQDGSLIRSMGTPGEGPGELGSVNGMTVFADGTVSVFDFRKFSLVVYGPDGEWIRDIRIDPARTGFPNSPMLPMPYHTVMAGIGGRVVMNGSGTPEEPGRAIIAIPLEEEAGDPSVLLRAWEAPPPEGDGEEATMRGEGGGSMTFQMARMRGFTPALRLHALRDGRVLIADTTTYRIEVYAADGTFQDELARPIAPVQVTSAIEDKERQRRIDGLSEGNTGVRIMSLGGSGGGSMQAPDMTEVMRNQIENMIFYPEIQVIERIAADWQDRIWVQRASGDPGEPGPTDVITADGGYLGTLPPDGLRIPSAFGPDGLAVWIETDEYDAERVVVARITESQG